MPAAIVVPSHWLAGAASSLIYHDRPGSVARVRFIGPTMQAVSVHPDAKCTPPCKTKVPLSLAMSGRYIVEATRMYKLSGNESVIPIQLGSATKNATHNQRAVVS